MMEKSRRGMLEYCKLILSKIRFDKQLFWKEYRKAFNYLKPNEHQALKEWVRKGLDEQNTRGN
jgi:hypothetical protein